MLVLMLLAAALSFSLALSLTVRDALCMVSPLCFFTARRVIWDASPWVAWRGSDGRRMRGRRVSL